MFTDVYMYTDPTSNPTPINIWHVPHNPTLYASLIYREANYIHTYTATHIWHCNTEGANLQHTATRAYTYTYIYTYIYIHVYKHMARTTHTHKHTHIHKHTRVCA